MRTPAAVITSISFVVLISSVSVSSAGPLGALATRVSQAPSARPMLDAWQAFAAEVGAREREMASFPFDSDQRLDWYYTPVERTGLPIGALDEGQLATLKRFLRTGLGADGTAQAFDIVALEEVLYEASGGRAMRDPGNYFLGIFGDPAPQGPWGWRFEGHHLSVSFTVRDGRVVSATPAFFGGNPTPVPDDAPVHRGLDPFAREQQAAHQVVATFTGSMRDRVLIGDMPPDDILTSNDRRARMGTPEGVAIADMSEAQRRGVVELLGLFAARMAPELADYQMARIDQAGIERVHFAWAGGTEPGARHYFRIHGPTFVVEWDNTQGNGTHVHSVWRDFDDDFGYDPLGQHLAVDHGLVIPGLANVGSGPPAAGAPDDARRIRDDHDARAHGVDAPDRHAHAGGAPHRH